MPTPALNVGALASLGYVKQTTMGTAVAVPASAGQWVPITGNTLAYDLGQHLIMTGSGSRGAEQYGAPGQAKTAGDFTIPLFAQTGANLLSYFLGTDTPTSGTYWQGTTSAVSAGASGGTLTATGGSALNSVITGTSYITVDYGNPAQETVQLATLNTSTGVYTISGTFANAHSAAAPVYIGQVHVLTPSAPQLLTIEDQWSGQSYQTKDCMLDQLDITSSGTEWTAKYTVLGGDASVALSLTTPTFATDIIPLAWPHVTSVTLPASVTAGETHAIQLTLANGCRQFWGGGSKTATYIKGGVFTAKGQFDMLFDSAAVASAYAAYIASTRFTFALTIAPNQNQSIAFNLPTCRVLTAPKQFNLQELTLLRMTFGEEKPMALSVTVTNADNAGY